MEFQIFFENFCFFRNFRLEFIQAVSLALHQEFSDFLNFRFFQISAAA